MKLAVFYHCLFVRGNPPVPLVNGPAIIREQMDQLVASGLLLESEFYVGINGGVESEVEARSVIPPSAKITFHGLQHISETPTIIQLHDWCKSNLDGYVLYFHSKGATHTDVEYLKFVTRWRRCMTENTITQWRRCVADLDAGYESVGCHWMTNMAPPSEMDSIWGGNFWWARADFIATLPSILDRDLIKLHGVTAPIARYESERWIGGGPRLPKVKDYHINGIGSCP